MAYETLNSFGQTDEGGGSPEGNFLRQKLSELRASIEAKRAAKLSLITETHVKHIKQAAHGRDTKQIKPKHAGYSTESEKIMGGSTGYYKKPVPAISGLGEEINIIQAAQDVKKATELVKQLTIDVQAGVVPKSDLIRAMADLESKINIVKQASNLSGFGEDTAKFPWLWVIVGLTAVFFLMPKA